jgi:hypothetical protein
MGKQFQDYQLQFGGLRAGALSREPKAISGEPLKTSILAEMPSIASGSEFFLNLVESVVLCA